MPGQSNCYLRYSVEVPDRHQRNMRVTVLLSRRLDVPLTFDMHFVPRS